MINVDNTINKVNVLISDLIDNSSVCDKGRVLQFINKGGFNGIDALPGLILFWHAIKIFSIMHHNNDLSFTL